ncbi:MAG: TonB-dependent siderophore receptor [Pseudomonadota bacterium]
MSLGTAPSWAQSQDDDVVVTQEILVEGDTGVVTEGTGTYVAPRATVGGRQPQEIREVPQTVTVLTRQRLDDAAATTIEEAAYTLPGLTTATGDGFQASLYARGQEVFQYYVDGAPRPYLSLYGTAPDLFFFDRVEIMSGPSGVFQGSGEPVGTLNLVRKRPLDTIMVGVGGEGTSFGGFRGEVDVSSPLNKAASIRGRFALIGEEGESFVDFNQQDRIGGYGTVEIDLTPMTTLALGTIVEHLDRSDFSGLPTFTNGTLIPLARSTFIAAPYDVSTTDTYEFFAELEHAFSYGGVAKATVRQYERDSNILNALGISGVDPATGAFRMFNFARDFEESDTFADINLTSPFDISGINGEVVVGADYRRTDQTTLQQFDFSPGAQNIYSFDPLSIVKPVITFPGVGPGFNRNTQQEVNEYGLYAQARAEVLPGLKLNVGGRFSVYDSSVTDIGRGGTSSIDEKNFAPYGGITYDVTDAVTIYGSFASIFQPQTELQFAGGNVEPRIGNQYEAGVKGEFMGGKLLAQASVYHIRDRNRAVADPANVGFFLGTGEADTNGVEVLVTGSPLPGFEISAGYSFVDTELTTDPTSPNNFVAFGKYTFDGGRLDGLSLGAGVRAADGFDNQDGAITIKAGGYTVFDAFLGYELTDNVDLQVNVYNLLDRTYYERVNEVIRGNFYGAPLNATFRLSAKF